MHLIFIYSPGKLSIFIMCLAIPIYTFDSHRLKKNPLNGWGKGKNKQTPVLMQTLHQETVSWLQYIRVNPPDKIARPGVEFNHR